MALDAVLDPGMFRSPHRAIVGESDDLGIAAVLTPASCADGMSGRAYGLEATLVVGDAEGRRMLTGCCSIARVDRTLSLTDGALPADMAVRDPCGSG